MDSTTIDADATTSQAAHSPALGGLEGRLPTSTVDDPAPVLDAFLEWVEELGFELFPAQEEALLELWAGRHVILNTPTGSGKSLVATGLHFKTLATGGISYYTSPIKALASEKFFDLCASFGAANVGMLTGDASINADAPIICCTAEVLSNLALRYGEALHADSVVMDEFHYYGDRDRGVAWQVPLCTLPNTQFLLMSATLGNPAPIREALERQTRRPAVSVLGSHRPVPLEFEYRDTPIHETVQSLADAGRAPIYVVSFTQRECAELAQALSSLQLTDKHDKARIREAFGDFRFDTAYGKDMRRFLGFGIGVHHAGLLPKYRLLVEQLSQQGLLRVICGTDTLGVGVNIPIRTVLFRKLCKYDGEKMTILAVRDFQQIAGRAGRKGFDDRGWVVCQAPEHVIENQRLDEKIRADPKKAKKLKKKTAPDKGYLHWDKDTFQRLIDSPPETLVSQFRISHGMILNCIQRDATSNDPDHDNFFALRSLIRNCHESCETKQQLTRDAAALVRSLHRAGILAMRRDRQSDYFWVVQAEGLQIDFSLHHALSLYLIDTLGALDNTAESYAADLLSLVEAILENPDLILRRQADKARDELFARLKADGVPYEERIERVREVTWPKPNAELFYATFNAFRARHPWIAGDNVRPKAIAREMWQDYLGFGDFVRRYGIQRTEGLLLRYLSQVFKTLTQTVPDDVKSDDVWDLIGFFRALISRVDTSLIDEWEVLLTPSGADEGERSEIAQEQQRRVEALELLNDPRAFQARIRAELYQLVRALAQQDWEEAAACVHHPDSSEAEADQTLYTAETLETAMSPFFEEYPTLVFTPEARQSKLTRIVKLDAEKGVARWEVSHNLLDPEGDLLWHISAEVRLDLSDPSALAASGALRQPLLRVRSIAS